ARLEVIMASMPDGIVVFTPDGGIQSWNPATEELFGHRGDELARCNISQLVLRQRDQPYRARELIQHLWSRRHERLEVFGVRKDGALLYLELAIDRIRHTDPPQYLAIVHDVSARKQAEADLDRMANFDPLTHLPNRSLYLDRLRIELIRARRYRRQLAVLFLDLDDFKKVNDSLGHLAGDLLLQEVAHRLSGVLRESDTVARFGGDEFAFIVADLAASDNWRTLATKILAALASPFHLEGRELFIKASIGVSLFPEHGNDPHTLLRHADIAMYRAKRRGHNQICCYDPSMETETTRRVAMKSQLHRALERNEFQLLYQPKVATDSRRIIGMEVLLRWHSQTLGPVSPVCFIPLLEEMGLIQEVGRWVLRTALTQTLRWQKSTRRPLEVAVNISSCQIDEAGFGAEVIAVLEELGFPAHCLELEITESILMEGTEVIQRNISALRERGVRFAIDDFGTGYSSLSYLRNFAFDTLKIDRSFLQNLDDERDLALAGHIVAIGHSLDLVVVAEGVENEAQLDIVTRLGCDLVQGYLFYRPMEADAMTALLHKPEV
ncbi:MAG TPA: EAL domain-containing protein, partial [Methylothermaceae bacterium]|nr:EAL domain-containing protein [Methylothermaceae bacterium]